MMYRIKSCLDHKKGMPYLIRKGFSFDLIITNPPWGKDYDGAVGSTGEKSKSNVKYDDKIENKYEFHKKWFELAKKLSDLIIIRIDNDDLCLWCHIQKPNAYFYNHKKNGTFGSKIATFNNIDVYIVYGKTKKFFSGVEHNSNVFEFHSTCGKFLQERKNLKHNSPDNTNLWITIIRKISNKINVENVLDPFLGSGTLGRACKFLDINWVGYEINKVYEEDIIRSLNIKKGSAKKRKVNVNKSVLG